MSECLDAWPASNYSLRRFALSYGIEGTLFKGRIKSKLNWELRENLAGVSLLRFRPDGLVSEERDFTQG
jgi:hypothetical protein